jgi:hypothetical protein
MCNDLTGDNSRTSDDYGDLGCATQARLRVFGQGKTTPALERCIDFGASTPVDALFGASPLAGGLMPHPFGSVDASRPATVEIAVYGPGSPLCPADGPQLAVGRSAAVDLRSQSLVTVPLVVRRACGLVVDGTTLAVRNLEDLATPPTPALNMGELFPYAALLSTDGVCRSPTVGHAGELRRFTAMQTVDSSGPTTQISGRFFFDQSPAAGCTPAHVDDGNGGVDACVANDPGSGALTVWLPSADHLAKVRALNRAVPGVRNGALVLRALGTDHTSSFVGAKLSFVRDGKPSASYVLNADWSRIAATPPGTTSEGLGVAVMPDAPTGQYLLEWGDGNAIIFNAGAAADPGAVSTVLVAR